MVSKCNSCNKKDNVYRITFHDNIKLDLCSKCYNATIHKLNNDTDVINIIKHSFNMCNLKYNPDIAIGTIKNIVSFLIKDTGTNIRIDYKRNIPFELYQGTINDIAIYIFENNNLKYISNHNSYAEEKYLRAELKYITKEFLKYKSYVMNNREVNSDMLLNFIIKSIMSSLQ